MKGFAFILFTLLLSNAQAETWKVTKCSNSDGTVKWESGVNDKDLIHLKYANFIEGTLTLDVKKVSIQFTKDVTLKERSFSSCHTQGKGRVYAGKVRIVGSEKHPNVLRSHFPENRVQTEVICTTVVSEQTECI